MVVNNLAKLMDLGLSRFANDSLESTDDEDSIMGTPQYISPEQLIGGDMDFRGDMYSLGATLYHFITGEFPFSGTSVTEIARKHLQEPLTPPSHYDASIPKSVCKLLDKMMAKQPEDRFQSMEALSKEIEKIRRANNTSTTSTSKHSGIHIRTKGRRKMASEGGRTAHRPVTTEASARTGQSRRISSRNIALDSAALQAYVDTSSHGKLKAGAIAIFILTIVVAVVVKL
jgi:eukaryotic-like serine/threonine-protein kinase